MKQLLLFLFLSTILQIAYGQTTDLGSDYKPPRKNTIWLEAYKPIYSDLIKAVIDDYYLIKDGDIYERSKNSYSLGIAYEHMFKNNLVLRSRLGFSEVAIVEESLDEMYNDYFEGLESYTDQQAYEYKEMHYNLFLGLAKKVSLNEKVNLDIGLEFAGISYQGGESAYFQNTNWITTFSKQWSKSEIHVNYEEHQSIGVGPILKPEYIMPMGLSFSVEIQLFFMKTISNDKYVYSSSAETIYTQNGTEQIYIEEVERETELVLSEWSWSELSPLVRIGYRF